MANSDRWDVWVRDGSNERVHFVDDWTSFDILPTVNGVGAWSLNLPYTSSARAFLEADRARIEFRIKGAALATLTGFVDEQQEARDSGGAWVTYLGPDDNALCWERIVYPDATAEPAGAPPAWGSAYDRRTGKASTVMMGFVRAHVGDGATPWRDGGVTVEAIDPLVGVSGTWQGRFEHLGDLLNEIGAETGLVWRIVGLKFYVWAPPDLTGGPAKLSEALGNLNTWSRRKVAAAVSHVYVGGGGEGAARIIQPVSSVAAGRRKESFADRRDLTDVDELISSGTGTLNRDARSETLTFLAQSVANMTYGVDYVLGDEITAVVAGTAISQVVREVRIVVSGLGEAITPTLGDGTGLITYTSPVSTDGTNHSANVQIDPSNNLKNQATLNRKVDRVAHT